MVYLQLLITYVYQETLDESKNELNNIDRLYNYFYFYRKRSYYRTVNKKSVVEEELFGNTGMIKYE